MYGWRATIGFMLPSSCLVYEQEFLKITRNLAGVIGVPARLLITQCDLAGLSAMNEHIDLAAKQLATCRPDTVVYMCTSGSFMRGNTGEKELRDRIAERTGRPVMTTSQAVLSACQHFGMKRLAMLTPYDKDLTQREVKWFSENGVQVTDVHFRDIPENLDRGAQAPEESFKIASRLKWQDTDGIMLSCANVRSLEIIHKLEQHTGKPVISSSIATTWMALRMSGVREAIPGFGRLLSENLTLQ